MFTRLLLVWWCLFFLCNRCDDSNITVAGESPTAVIITCKDTEDYHTLLYQTCRRFAPCSRAYYLRFIPNATIAVASPRTPTDIREFHKFVYQIKRLVFFNHPRSVLNGLLPQEWQPPITVVISNASTGCSGGGGGTHHITAAMTTDGQLFTYSALLAMQNFKMYVADESLCAEANEQLVMTGDSQVECLCLLGKSCQNESNYSTVLIVLIAVFLAAVVLWIPSIFVGLFVTTQRMHTIMGRK